MNIVFERSIHGPSGGQRYFGLLVILPVNDKTSCGWLTSDVWFSSSGDYEWGGLHKSPGGIWGWLWERSGLADQWGKPEWGPGKSGLSIQCNLYKINGKSNCISSLCFLFYLASLFYCVKRSVECCCTYCRPGAICVPDPALWKCTEQCWVTQAGTSSCLHLKLTL